MDSSSGPSRWPWRKWLLTGAAMAGTTTLGGTVAIEGGYGCGCPSIGTGVDACAAIDACQAPVKDVRTDAPKQEEASVDSGAPDAGDGSAEASDGGAPPG
jgi:hypothetical protein